MLKVIFPSVLWKIFHASSAIRDGRFNLEHLGYISQLRHNIVISVNLSHPSLWRIQTLSSGRGGGGGFVAYPAGFSTFCDSFYFS